MVTWDENHPDNIDVDRFQEYGDGDWEGLENEDVKKYLRTKEIPLDVCFGIFQVDDPFIYYDENDEEQEYSEEVQAEIKKIAKNILFSQQNYTTKILQRCYQLCVYNQGYDYEIFDIAAQVINDNSDELGFPENFIAIYMSHNRKSWPMTGYLHLLQSNHQYCLLRSLQFSNNKELISKICDELNIDWNLWLEFQGDTNYEYSG